MNPYSANKHKYAARNTSVDTLVAKRGVIIGFNRDNWNINIAFYQDDNSDNQPGAVQVPLGTLWAGNQWGMCFAPELGTEVVVVFANASLQQPLSISQLFNNENLPIPGLNPGEGIIKHQSGSLLKFTNDGKVTLIASTELDFQAPIISMTATTNIKLQAPLIESDATVSITNQAPIINEKGNVVITGTLSANNGAFTMDNSALTTTKNIISTQDVTASGISLKTHVHGGVTAGGDSTSPPTG